MIARWARFLALGGALGVAVGVTLGISLVAGPARAADQSVNIVDFAFNPAEISIAVNDRVIWTNSSDTQHTVTSDTGQFDSGGIVARQSYVVTFQRAGDFPYRCRVHPQQMRGVVHVAGGGTPTPTTAPAPGPTTTVRPGTPPSTALPPIGAVPPPPTSSTSTTSFLVPTTTSLSTSSTIFEENPQSASGGSSASNNDDTKRRVAGGIAGALVAAGVVSLVLVRRAQGV